MTSPTWDAIGPEQEQAALDNISKMMTGTKMLQDEPGVVYALASQRAHPADAQAIDQFMQGLDAEKQVTLARATGHPIVLSDQQKTMLTALNVDYSDVEYKPEATVNTAQQTAQNSVNSVLTGMGMKPDDAPYKAKGIGRLFHDLNNWVARPLERDVLDPALHGIAKPLNFVQTGLSDTFHGAPPGSFPGLQLSVARQQDMADQGYDPNNIWSQLAFRSSGKAHSDLTPLAQKWDQQNPSGLLGMNGSEAVDQAVKFMDNPKGYRQSLENDPTLIAAEAAAKANPTNAAVQNAFQAASDAVGAKIDALSSKQFTTLTTEVAHHTASVGNDLANAVFGTAGWDDVHSHTAYSLLAAGANLAAAFAIDPLMVTGSVVKAAKMSQIGIDSLADSEHIAAIIHPGAQAERAATLDSATESGAHAQTVAAEAARSGHFVNRNLSGLSKLIDYGHEITAAGDDEVRVAALTARVNAELPTIAPLLPDVLGKNMIVGYTEAIVDGKRVSVPVLGGGPGIHSLAELSNYVASKMAFTRLMNGRAATQSSLMPGAVSAWGYRRLKGATSEWMTTRAGLRAEGAYSTVTSAAEADPDLAEKLIEEGSLMRLQPQADDAVSALDGQTIASADRYALTPAGKGDVLANLRKSGSPFEDGAKLGWANPTAIAARARIAAIRLSTQLPRNQLIDINDAQSGDKIYKMAMTYMNRYDANSLRAAWNAGDGGQRKAIVGGLIDQLGHAAGLGKNPSGQLILDGAKTPIQAYASSGDGIVKDGQELALHVGQTRTTWMLPTFRALQQASAKTGLWEWTFGRALTSDQGDLMMAQWKMGVLFKPSTWSRNMLEGWSRTALEGEFGPAVRARVMLTTPNKELWAAGHGVEHLDAYTEARGKVEGLQKMLADKGVSLEQRADGQAQITEAQRVMALHEDKPIVAHMLAEEASNTARTQHDALSASAKNTAKGRALDTLATEKAKEAKLIARSSMLTGDVLGRSSPATRLAESAPVALAGRAYRRLYGRVMDEDTVKALLTLGHDDLTRQMELSGQQMTEADLGMARAAREGTEITRAGYGPATVWSSVKRAVKRGKEQDEKASKSAEWTQHDTDGTLGIDRYANALARAVNATPTVARAVLDHLENPEFTIRDVVTAMDDPAIRAKMNLTAFGSVWWPSGDGTGQAVDAYTDAERLLGKQDFARKVVNDYAHLLHGQNGEYQGGIADQIRETGKAPDTGWLTDNITKENRPKSVLAPDTMPMPSGGIKGLIGTLQDVQGGGYQWMVERALQRTTSSPVFTAMYAEARVGMNKTVDALVEQHGISREAAENLAKEVSIKNAQVRTEQLIDDPGQKTQFDVVARNIFPFSRATQAMIRRWGTGMWQDPSRARKMMLAYEGAESTGMVYTNEYGEPTFTYPGSGVMNMLMREVAKIPGFEGLSRFPVSAAMTGGVLMSVPGADNPLRMSMGPMISIPMREVFKLFPDHREVLDEIDSAINGPIGVGQTTSQLVPTLVRKFYTAADTDQRNSALASAYAGAFANLAAAGLVPPPSASADVMQAFKSRLQLQVRNQLYIRFVLGLFAPAAPSQPTEGTSASQADYAFHVSGVGQLADEYKTILNETKGDVARTNAIWTAMHPDSFVYGKDGSLDSFSLTGSAYETARSQATASKVALPATGEALNWMAKNQGFISKYHSVAAYFLPEGSGNEPFNNQAYQTQLELQLRQKKTPTEFMNDIYVRHAESVYYPTVAGFDKGIADAKAVFDSATAATWTDAKQRYEADFKNLNPAFGAKTAEYGTARATALDQVASLENMLKTGDVPDGLAPQLGDLVSSYNNLTNFDTNNTGSGNAATALRQQALDGFNTWAQKYVAGTPLADLYAGVFRTLNNNFVNLQQAPTG